MVYIFQCLRMMSSEPRILAEVGLPGDVFAVHVFIGEGSARYTRNL